MPEPIRSPIDALCIWRFAGVRFDERTLEVERGDGSVETLERKPNDVLRHLLRHAGEVVTKNELLDRVWPGRYVTEGVLSKHVARLRRAIGDETQQILRTVPGIGYRLVADVSCTAAPPSPEFPPLELIVGQRLEQRPNWRLEQRLGRNRSIEVWRLRHVDTGEQRVFKLCTDEADLVSLKREITISRLLGDDLEGLEPGHVPIIDWNLEHSPFWIELPWLADGSLLDWWRSRTGQWSLAERIELAAGIAQALARAHELGVLHKDLKPANVLIDRDDSGRALPKLADFGSARLLDPNRLPELGITKLGFTQTVSGWSDTGGTPLYLAPEVIHGAPFTLASDLYAFGTILYQLVIDDPRQPLAAGWERAIEDELLREDIAALVEGDPGHRLADAGVVARQLRTLEARRAERTRERGLARAAEQARLDAEQARRRRNLASAFAGILLLALIATTALFLRAQTALELARSEADRADRQAARAAAVSEFLTEDLLAMADPFVAGEEELSIRRAIEFARVNIDRRFEGQPEIEAAVRLRIGAALRNLGEPESALTELERGLELTQSEESQALGLFYLAHVQRDLGRFDEAAASARRRLSLSIDDPAHYLQAQGELNFEAIRAGDYTQGAVDMANIVAEAERQLGSDHLVTIRLRNDLANVRYRLGEYAEAESLMRTQVELSLRRYGPNHPEVLRKQRDLAAVLIRSDQLDEALPLIEHVHREAVRVLGASHHDSLLALNQWATALQGVDRLDEALPLFRTLLDLRRAKLGDEHADTLLAMNNLGSALSAVKQYDEALSWLQRVLEAERRHPGEHHPEALVTAHNLGRTLRDAGRLEEALERQQHTAQLAREHLPEGHFMTGVFLGAMADTQHRLGDTVSALELAREATGILDASLGPDHTHTRAARSLVERFSAE